MPGFDQVSAGPVGEASARPVDELHGERQVLAALAVADGLGPRRLTDLVAWHGSVGRAIAAAERRLHGRRPGRRSTRVRDVVAPEPEERPRIDPLDAEPALAAIVVTAAAGAARLAAAVARHDLAVLTLDDPGYPARLRAIEDTTSRISDRSGPSSRRGRSSSVSTRCQR